MSESMITRVARAIYEVRNGAGCKPWPHITAAHQGPYLKDARAAIEAMLPALNDEAKREYEESRHENR